MKKKLLQLILLIFISITSFGQYKDTVYIDPDYTGSSTGSITQPYKYLGEWNNVQGCFNSNTAYLIKRGTSQHQSKLRVITSGQHDIMIGDYGVGDKPIIERWGEVSSILRVNAASNVLIDNLRLEGDTTTINNHTGSLIRVDKSIHLDINQCYLRGASWDGINSSSPKYLHVDSTVIRFIKQEGIYVGGSHNIPNFEVSYCTIDSINTGWFTADNETEAGGDCIQIAADSIHDWWIHHNYIDKSWSTFKFCFICTKGGGSSVIDRSGIFEYNTVITQHLRSDRKQGGAGLFSGLIGTIIRYNDFQGIVTGVLIKAPNQEIYGNVFHDFIDPEYAALNTQNNYVHKVYNNVFYNNVLALIPVNSDVRNNIFIKNTSLRSWGNYIADYNCYYDTPYELGDNHYITNYPKFVDTANRDFHLLFTSPCIDAGTDVGLKNDKDGTLLPQGSGFDMGIYEFNDDFINILPTVKLISVYNVQETSAIIEGEITNEGTSPVIGRGITIYNNYGYNKSYKMGEGIGIFKSTFKNLLPNTEYYTFAYAISYDTVKSNIRTFKTKSIINLPKCNTLPVELLNEGFVSGIEIIDDGGIRLDGAGICWKYYNILSLDLIEDPTIDDNVVKINIPSIYPHAEKVKVKVSRDKYILVRSFAINKKGVTYGETYKVDKFDIPIIEDPVIIIQDTVLIHLNEKGFIKIKRK
jgi:hypothetical protein